GLLAANGIDVATTGERLPALLAAGAGPPVLVEGSLSQGFRLPIEPWGFVGEGGLFGGRRPQRRGRQGRAADLLPSLAELKSGDFVVHVDHGIGLYRGLKHLNVADTEGDFLHLEYQGGDRMYVPVDRINLVQKYVGGGDGTEPALDKLGGT